jgi:hypothetical protein
MCYVQKLGLILIAAVVPASAAAAPTAVCAPPAGFADKPHPAIAAEQLVSHT